MPLSLRRGSVTAIVVRQEGLVRCEVDGEPCVAYPRLTGPVALGDDVLVNVQARELGLDSGGFDLLHANLTRGLGLRPAPGAHVLKLPYSPLQYAARHAEEDGEPRPLDGRAVVCLTLHSQLAPVCAALSGLRVAYVQLPGGALPVSLSDVVRAFELQTVAVGACFDGDREAVNAASGLLCCDTDVIVCGIGPGVVATGSRWGHGAVAAADAANAASALGARPILCARVSDADASEAHLGVSHHTRAALALCLGDVTVAWPAGRQAPAWLVPRQDVDTSGWREACAGLPLSHQDRGLDADPAFFEAAYAAGVLARG